MDIMDFLNKSIRTSVTAASDAVNDLVHSGHDKPDTGSLVVIQTMSGAVTIGEFHDSETIGGYVRLSRQSVCPWGSVLRWFYPKDVFGGEEGV